MADNIINGTVGNDTINKLVIGTNNVITAGTGNDTFALVSTNSDTQTTANLRFNAGDGQDSVLLGEILSLNAMMPAVSSYQISFGEGVRPQDVQVRMLEAIPMRVGNGREAITVNIVSWQLVNVATGDAITVTDRTGNGGLFDVPTSLQRVSFSDGTVWTPAQVVQQWRLADNSTYTVYGGTGDDVLQGNADAHALQGGFGNDTIIAGSGNELITPGFGQNVIRFAAGSGQDTLTTVVSRSNTPSPLNTIEFTSGVTKADLSFSRVGEYDVLLSTPDGSSILFNSLALGDVEPAYLPAFIKFANGEQLTSADILGQLVAKPTSGNDDIRGLTSNDVLTGLAGDDTLYGLDGNDTLTGGAGNDSLRGGFGNDTYVFNRGDGHDTIAVDASIPTTNPYVADKYANRDVVQLGEGIGFDDFNLSRVGALVRLDFTDGGALTGDSIDLDFGNGAGVNHTIQFADGNSLGFTTLDAILQLGFVEPVGTVTGTAGDDTLRAFKGPTVFDAGSGNDRIISGLGNDTINGGQGADVLVFGSGSGADTYESFEDASQDIIELTGNLGLNDFVINTPDLIGVNALSLVLKDGSAALLMTDQVKDGSGRITPISNLPSVKLADGTIINAADLYARRQQSTDGADTLYAGPFGQVSGGKGNDRLIASNSGSDMTGGEGDDTLVAGTGYDNLDGGLGADTFVVGRASDNVRFRNISITADSADTIEYAAGIGRSELQGSYYFNGQSVSLAINVAGFDRSSTNVNIADAEGLSLKFADGTVVKAIDLFPVVGVSLYGQYEDETLKGFLGNDTLEGTMGNDLLDGGAGADAYTYHSGDGNDTIVADTTDFLEFQTATAETLTIGKLGATVANAVVLGSSADGAGGTVTLTNAGQWAGLQVKLGDGTVVTGAQILAIATKPDNLTLIGTTQSDTLTGKDGNDTLSGGLLRDLLIGGLGQDTYLYNLGDGQDTLDSRVTLPEGSAADANNDTLILGPGLVLSDFLYQTDSEGLHLRRIEGGTFSPGSLNSIDWWRDGTSTDTILFNDASSITLTPFGQRILGGQGADTLGLINAGASIVQGGAGNDQIHLNSLYGADAANAVADVLFDAGFGQDTLYLRESPLSRYGSGRPTAFEQTAVSAYRIVLGSGISASDVELRQLDDVFTPRTSSGLDAGLKLTWQLRVKSTGDVLTVVDVNPAALGAGGTHDELKSLTSIVFADGQTWSPQQVLERLRDPANVATTLYGTSGDDVLTDNALAHVLIGGAGNDTLSSGAGNDKLMGDTGLDTYVYARGDGADTIVADSQDTIQLGAGIAKSDILIGKRDTASNTVVLQVKSATGASADSITLAGTAWSDGLQLTFADGSSLSGADILTAATRVDNVSLTGTTKADTLTGGDGNDTLSGLAGNDTLAGGKGNDSLIGGKGNDTYLFKRGDGQDVVVDADSTWFNSDLLKLGDATSKQLWLTKAGNNLDIQILGTSDKVTVQNWFAGSSNRVEKITASDGKSLRASKVNALVNAMASFTPPADATSLPVNAPAALTKLVASSWV